MVSRFILVCSSEFAEERFRALHGAGESTLVAVDGGFRYLNAIEVMPQVLLGDFDSLGYVPQVSGAQVIRFPSEKDASDLELALSYAEEQGADEVYVFGALGGRLDQTMATLQVATGFAETFDTLVFVSPKEVLRVLGSHRTLTLSGSGAKYVSVLSAVDVSRGVGIHGMKYDFDGELTNRSSRGLSNEMGEGPAVISVGDGVLFVVEQDE